MRQSDCSAANHVHKTRYEPEACSGRLAAITMTHGERCLMSLWR